MANQKEIPHSNDENFDFDVAISFATEDQDYVSEFALELGKSDLKIYFAPDDDVNSWGKDLYSYFDDIFRKKSRFVVMFLSKNYAIKHWTNHERKSAQARAYSQRSEYILPARFDATGVDGILPTVKYIDLKKFSPIEFAKIVLKKIGPISRTNFLPSKFDSLMTFLEVKKQKDEILVSEEVKLLFNALTQMKPNERELLWIAIENACAGGIPENIHLNFEVYLRATSLLRKQIISVFSRLKFLGFKTTLSIEKCENEQDEIAPVSQEKIKIIFSPIFGIEYKGKSITDENCTLVLLAYFSLLCESYCPGCAKSAFLRVDFSVLNSDTFSENDNENLTTRKN